VRFRPGCAAAFLRIPLAEITDTRVALGDLWKDWDDGLLENSSALVSRLEQELLRRLDPERDRRVAAAVAMICSNAAEVRIDDVAQRVGISRQHLARQFRYHVGVSPKMFARVMRFRALLSAIDLQENVDWCDAAVSHGYYDQSHLINEFRALAGIAPSSFHFSNP
jgi:AraC-like DNA-binding protein